jgi:hypothetical protein
MNLQEDVIKELNTLLFKFVWDGKEKVKRKTIINDYENGGMKMINLPIFLQSLKFSWIKRLTNDDIDATWKNIALFEFQKITMGLDIFKCNCNYDSLNPLCKKQINNMSLFYRKLVELWLNCKRLTTFDDINTPAQEIIWNNENIKYNGKTLFFKHWIRNGYIRILSLFNDDETMASMKDFNVKIVKPGGIMFDYNKLLTSLPKCWKTNLTKVNDECTNGINIFENGNLNFYTLKQCTSKIVKHKLTSNISVNPICQIFWEKKFPDYSFKWKNIWKHIPQNVKETRLITLNWKILCNIYPTNILLVEMGKADNKTCKVCNEDDYLEHFFFHCKQIRQLWLEVNKMILMETGRLTKLSVTDVMFGVYEGKQKENAYVNRLIIVAKLCISKYKYGKHPNLLFLFETELTIRKWLTLQ